MAIEVPNLNSTSGDVDVNTLTTFLDELVEHIETGGPVDTSPIDGGTPAPLPSE